MIISLIRIIQNYFSASLQSSSNYNYLGAIDYQKEFTRVNETALPKSYTATSNIVFMYFHSGSTPTKLDFYATFVMRNSSYFESQTLGDSDYCSGSNLCSANGGDCDFNTHCADGLTCQSDKCPSDMGYPIGTDCCYNYCQDGYSIFILAMSFSLQNTSNEIFISMQD